MLQLLLNFNVRLVNTKQQVWLSVCVVLCINVLFCYMLVETLIQSKVFLFISWIVHLFHRISIFCFYVTVYKATYMQDITFILDIVMLLLGGPANFNRISLDCLFIIWSHRIFQLSTLQKYNEKKIKQQQC